MYTERLTAAAAAPGDVRSANNSRIHPRSAFANSKPDFKALAEHYEGLRLHMAKVMHGDDLGMTKAPPRISKQT